MMNDVVTDPDACKRISAAIADGRFLEDPVLWRSHVDACSTCRASVLGLFALREHVRLAGLEAPVVDPRLDRGGPPTIARAFRRFRFERALRNTSIELVLLVAASIGFGVARGRESAAPENPFAYARRLHETVYGVGRPADYALLQRDERLRAEFMAALDHPSSYVRRTALSALLESAVPVDSARLERVLAEFNESLEVPISLASTSDDARAVSDALRRERSATVQAALGGLQIPAVPGVARIRSGAIVGFLTDSDAETRRDAILALLADPTYIPGAAIEHLMRSDLDVGVRDLAATLICERRGEEGGATVVARLREHPDEQLEMRVIPVLQKFRSGVELARERVDSEKTSPALALSHARTLYRRTPGHVFALPEAVIDRALRSPPKDVLLPFASLAAEADWAAYRLQLQNMWRAARERERTYSGGVLVRWDLLSPSDASRLALALEICESDRTASERAAVETLLTNDDATIRERAMKLLSTWPKQANR